MKVRILKSFFYTGTGKRYIPGDEVTLPDKEVETWLKSGLAEQDKLVEGPKETKTKAPKSIIAGDTKTE